MSCSVSPSPSSRQPYVSPSLSLSLIHIYHSPQPRERRHLLFIHFVRLFVAVVDRRHDEVFEHLHVFGVDDLFVQLDAVDDLFRVHIHDDRLAAARADDLPIVQQFFGLLHLLLELLRLLHEVLHIAAHACAAFESCHIVQPPLLILFVI